MSLYPNLRKLVAKELLFPDSTAAEIDSTTARLYADMKIYKESALWNPEYMLTMRGDQLTADEREDLAMEIETLGRLEGIVRVIEKYMYVRVSPFLRDAMRRDAFLDMKEDAREYLAPKLYKAFLADC